MNKLYNIMSGIYATIISGFFLLISLLLLLLDYSFIIDPAWMTIIISGIPLLYLALNRIYKEKGMKKISSALLISIAMIASCIINEVFAAGEVAFIMAIGAILEEATVKRTQKGIKVLIKLTPETGRRINCSGTEEVIQADSIMLNDILRVLPGEKIPVDGIVLRGNTSIDQSIITGESLPVDKGINDSVFCGTLNQFGSIDILATKVGEDSTLKKLIKMVNDAEQNKAPMQRIVDRWASWLVPIALLIAIIVGLMTQDITRAVTILVVFCPCALALATPTSVMAAIGQATKHGVLIKSGEALEKMGKAKVIAFDKTGTLTTGKLQVADLIKFDESISIDQLLTLVASAEAKSEHPLGKAIYEYAKDKVRLFDTTDFRIIPGKGVIAKIDNETIICGNIPLMVDNKNNIPTSIKNNLSDQYDMGKAIVIVASSKLLGAVTLTDTLRANSKEVISDLKQLNADVVLLTGDNHNAAHYFATLLGVTQVEAELLPDGKVRAIKKLQLKSTVCMVGDGVNDAPALKQADVSIAMGNIGSDVAIESADIALVGDSLEKIPYIKRLANATTKTIMFNISLSMIINFIAIILSALNILNPVTGALVHNCGSVLIVLNAALLYDRNYLNPKNK